MADPENLSAYYALNSTLMIHYKYSLRDLDDMIPWEREAYIFFIEQYIKEKNESTQTGMQNGRREYA